MTDEMPAMIGTAFVEAQAKAYEERIARLLDLLRRAEPYVAGRLAQLQRAEHHDFPAGDAAFATLQLIRMARGEARPAAGGSQVSDRAAPVIAPKEIVRWVLARGARGWAPAALEHLRLAIAAHGDSRFLEARDAAAKVVEDELASWTAWYRQAAKGIAEAIRKLTP